MSAFEQAWLFLKQGALPNLFGDDDDEDKKPQLPNIFDNSGNLLSVKDNKVSAQEPQPLSAPANIAPIGDGPQLAVLGHRKWGLMHDDQYPKEALYQDMERFDESMQQWIDIHGRPSHIISGGYGGTDDLAQQWADDNEIPLTVHSPRFKEDGRFKALGARNDRIVDSASHFLLFPHPMGSATQDAWMKANATGKPIHTQSVVGPDAPIRDVTQTDNEEIPHWYREFIGDDRAKIVPEDSKKRTEGSAQDKLAAAMRNLHGKQYGNLRMRVQSNAERANKTSSGTVAGFPTRAAFTSKSGRYIPKDTRTDDEKAHDRLIEMAQEAGSQIQVQPREGGGKSKEQQLEELREARDFYNEHGDKFMSDQQAQAMGSLPVSTTAPTPMSEHHEAQMHEDMAAAQEGREPEKLERRAVRIPAHRGTRGGRNRDEVQFADDNADAEDMAVEADGDLEAAELKRRIKFNERELKDAKRLGRPPDELSTEKDENGKLEELSDPHFIDDLRFQKMLRGLSPIDAAFLVIKGCINAR